MAKVKFFTNWQVYNSGIRQLIAECPELDNYTPVWRGANGSYAVGDREDVCNEEHETDLNDYVEAGSVADYRDYPVILLRPQYKDS